MIFDISLLSVPIDMIEGSIVIAHLLASFQAIFNFFHLGLEVLFLSSEYLSM